MDVLKQEIKRKNVILFVGSGVSHGLGLPTWSSLISTLGKDLGYDPELFGRMADFLSLAEFYKNQKGGIGQLRSKIDKEWHSANVQIENSEVHNLILKIDSPLIYTTNYDSWLERAYSKSGKKFRKISSVEDLLSPSRDETQIVKFHGDFDHDDSLVLTESDYFRRLAFEDPLDIKLRSDALARPILFIGYSLSDINVRYLLFKLSNLWSGTPNAQKRPRSHIFLSSPNPVQTEILKRRGVHSIVSGVDDPQEGLLAFLRELVTT